MTNRRTLAAALLLLAVPAAAGGQDLPADVCATIRQVRGTGPITSHEQLGAMLNRIAWEHRTQGLGLSRKTSGNRCPSPAGDVACDILQRGSDHAMWDIFGSAEPGAATTPQCGAAIGVSTDPARPWVPPVNPGGAPIDPPPPPPPPPAGTATAELQQQQILLLLQVIQQQQAQLTALAEQNAAIVRGLTELKAAIAAGVKIRF